jgi:cytochrome c
VNKSVHEVGRVLLVAALVVWMLSGVVDVKAEQTAGGLGQQIQQTPPSSDQAKRIEAMVNKAAVLVESQGKAAFSEFRKSDSEWWFGNTYLFAYDQNLNVLLNPAFPKREGTNPRGQKDANGKAFHDEFLRVVQTKGSGWVDYMFPKPGQTQLSQKWSYVKAVNIDGTPAIIGAGFYPE